MERYRPPRRTGSSAGHPHGGPWSRVFVTGAARTGLPCFSHGKSIREREAPGCRTRRVPYLLSQAHPGLTCLGADRTAAPARTLLSLPLRPERYLIRLPEGQAWSIAQEAVRRIGKDRSLLPKGRPPRWPQAIRGSIPGRCNWGGGDCGNVIPAIACDVLRGAVP